LTHTVHVLYPRLMAPSGDDQHILFEKYSLHVDVIISTCGNR